MKVVGILASVLLVTAVPAGLAAPAAARESTPATATKSTPSDASLRRLIEVLNVRKLLESMSHQVDAVMKGTMREMLKGQPITPKQQEALDSMQSKMVALMNDELKWETVEPIYLKVYKDTFSQSEIDAMIGFYSSPTGHAVIEKMPLAAQSAMSAMQERMRTTLIPKLQQMVQDMATQIKAQNKDGAKPDEG